MKGELEADSREKSRMRFSRAVATLLIGLSGLGGMSQDKPNSKSSPSKVKSDAVTINLPEGMSSSQADAILQELKQIRQLLENMQNAGRPIAAQPAAPSAPDKVSMIMASGWYSIGRDDAPVTMVEFTDYQCPYCKRFHADTFAEIKKNYIDTGKVRFISRDLPLDFHPNALKAAQAAHCAGDQGKFWEMRDALISHAEDLGHDSIVKYATGISLNMTSFSSCLDGEKYKTLLQKEIADAGTLSISGTPTFVLGKVSGDKLVGERIVGAMPYSAFEGQIKKSLAAN